MSILLSFGKILTKILTKYLKEVILKGNIFRILLNQELEHSRQRKNTQEQAWALMSMHRPLWTLISTDKYGAKALLVLKAPWRQAHKCSLVLMSVVGAIAPCSWVLMATYMCSWMLKNIYEHIKTFHHDHSWTLMNTHGHSWALISNHEHL